MLSRSALTVLAAAIAAIAALPAVADYNSGVGAYSRKDFPAARTAFLEVAQLADAGAQRALASMHARGEGGAVDLLEAYAWASLAADQGDATAVKIRDAIVASLPATAKPQAEARLKDYRSKYGMEAIKQNFYPAFSGNESAVFDLSLPAARIRLQQPVAYPERAKEKNEQGYVCVSFYVDNSGKPLGIRNYDNKGSSMLVNATERSLAEWRFEPEPGERRVGHCVDFLIEDDKTWRSNEQIQQQQNRVRKGDARSLVDVARDFSANQHVVIGRVEAQTVTAAWLQAALSGAAEAQFELASRLLRGDGCVADKTKALRWLQLAIGQGYAPAQHYAAVTLATEKTLGISTSQHAQWLQAAATAGDRNAMLELAKRKLRPGPEQNTGDALALLSKLDGEQHIHVLDWRAYAYALAGDYGNADDDANDALDIAKEIGLATQARQIAVNAIDNESTAPLPAH